jgi:hypothetical protein
VLQAGQGGTLAALLDEVRAERQENSALRADVKALVKQVETPDVNISEVPSTVYKKLMRIYDVERASLPSELGSLMPRPAPAPFRWARPSGDEHVESPALNSALRDLVNVPGYVFHDVHAQRANLLSFEEAGVGDFSGTPDTLVISEGLALDYPLESVAKIVIDWKTPVKYAEKPKIRRTLTTMALAVANGRNQGCPVFITDMASGMRCAMVVSNTVMLFHSDSTDLSLAEGIALIRYFLKYGGRLGPQYILPPSRRVGALPSAAAALQHCQRRQAAQHR